MTLAAAVLDPVKHTVGLINAGHVVPLIYRAETEELVDAMIPTQGNLPLGVEPGTQYEIVEVTLGPDDAVLIFTDGVTDALNPETEQFNVAGVKKAVIDDEVQIVAATGLSPSRLGKKVVDAVRAHIADRDQYDDIALVAFGRYEPPPASGPSTKLSLNTPAEPTPPR